MTSEREKKMGVSVCLEDIKERKSEKCELKGFEEDQKPLRRYISLPDVCSKAAFLHGEQGSGAFLQVLSPLLIRSFTRNMA